MLPADGFRDDWKWTRTFTFGGFAFCVMVASWLTFSNPDGEQTTRRTDSWLTLAGALALYYMGRAGADGISRRQAVTTYETTKLRVSKPAGPDKIAADHDAAAG